MSLPSQGQKGRGRQVCSRAKTVSPLKLHWRPQWRNLPKCSRKMVVCFLLSTWRRCELFMQLRPRPDLLLTFDTRNKGRLTSSVCRSFASLFIPANLCDHWGRIVHHIQLWFPALSSQSKVGKLFADTELLHEVNIYESRGARERRRKNTLRKQTESVAQTVVLQRVHFRKRC